MTRCGKPTVRHHVVHTLLVDAVVTAKKRTRKLGEALYLPCANNILRARGRHVTCAFKDSSHRISHVTAST